MMSALLLCLFLAAQDPAADVGALVGDGDYAGALSAAEKAEGAERSLLLAWTRHHAGDLQGALEEAAVGLSSHPDHVGLLEQAAWITGSLHRGEESMRYAKRLEALGQPSASAFIRDADLILSVSDDVRTAKTRAKLLLALLSLLAILIARWGIRPASS